MVWWARVEDAHLELDDTRYFHLPRVGASRVMVVDGDPGATAMASEVYFLERALAPWGGSRGRCLKSRHSVALLTWMRIGIVWSFGQRGRSGAYASVG